MLSHTPDPQTKKAFLQELDTALRNFNFETKRISNRFWGFESQNLITRCKHPEYIFLAHADTATILPLWGALLSRVCGHTKQIAASMAFIFLYLGLSSLRFSDHHWLTRAGAIMVGIMLASLVFFFLPNPHNQEDNSRGVIGLTTLAHWAKNKPGIKEKIQFAFLDN